MLNSAHIGGAMSLLQVALVILCFTTVFCDAEEKWSRELTGESNSEWVPLSSGPFSKRQASARVLTQPAPFQSSFFPAETYPSDYLPQEAPRQLYLQSIPSGQSGYQGNSLNQPLVQLAMTNPQYNPLAQAFVPQSNLHYNNNNQQKNNNYQLSQFQQQQSSLQGQFIQHPSQINNQFYAQPGSINSGLAPVPQSQKLFKQQDSPRFVDGYKLENVSVEYLQNNKKKPTSNAYKSKQEKIQEADASQRITERSSTIKPQPTIPTITTVEKEEVQLLYVPLETLQSDQFNMKEFLRNSQKQEALRDSIGSPGQINNQLYAPTTPSYIQRQQTQLHNIQQDLIQQAFNTQTLQAKFKQNPFDNRQSKYQQVTSSVIPFSQSVFPAPVITTPKSKKLKAHQPPLAVYMAYKGQGKAKLTDVLGVLKEAKTVSVLDSYSPNSPKIFIGPSTLRIPENYAKFELPYLSSVDGSRIQRKVEQLPFFVAPLSYKAPEGFAKIPFPPPHVGSVIINPYMRDPFDQSRLAHLDPIPNSFAFSNFQHNPSTESFRSTLSESSPTKQNNFNYFPSATPNPVQSSQSTLPSFQSSFLPFEPSTLGAFQAIQSSRNPEANVISSSRAPLASYFSTPASKPTISYFSFPGPDYTTIPTTSKKPSTSFNYDNRGHYITNAAVDFSSFKTKSPVKDSYVEKIQTTPIPQTTPKFQTQDPLSINQAFTFTDDQSPYEPVGLKSSVRANEIREYNTERPNQNTFNTYTQRPQQYSEIQNTQRPQQYSGFRNSPRPQQYSGFQSTQRPQQYTEIQNTQKPQLYSEYQNTQKPQQYSEYENTKKPQQYTPEFQNTQKLEPFTEIQSTQKPQQYTEFQKPQLFTEKESTQKPQQYSEYQKTQHFVEKQSTQKPREYSEYQNTQKTQQFVEKQTTQKPREYSEYQNTQTTQQFVEKQNTQKPREYSEYQNTQTTQQFVEKQSTQKPRQYSEYQNTQKTRQFVEKQTTEKPQQYLEFQDTQKPQDFTDIQSTQKPAVVETVQYTNDYSPMPFFSEATKNTPTETVPPPRKSQPSFAEDVYTKSEYKDSFSAIGNQYSSPSAEGFEEEFVYLTENPTTNEITTPTTTTTTTTTTTSTTPAPVTRATRRPIHSRGRPRYTTPKSDGETTTRQTVTRRTPIRERKPNQFRTKLENSRTSTTEANIEMPSYEPSKRTKLEPEIKKPSARHPAHRYRTQEDEAKTTTTESPTTKATVTNRNQRIRSRGRTHFKSSGNQDGAELILKKGKKQGEGESLAYQRDVLHQNYPVTFSERMTTLEVHSSTPMPSSQSVDLTNGKIRIYETTGITQRSSSESPFAADYFENQPIFQGEQEKFITHPEVYVEINGKGSSTPTIDQYVVSQETTTEKYISSTPKYEKLSEQPQVVSEEYFNIENYSQSTISENEQVFENKKQEIETTVKPVEEYKPELAVTEISVAKFRSKLRSRPKLLAALNVPKEIENVETLASPKKVEESTESSYGFTRRSSLQPVTYRPAFDRRRTTMRIEEIEAELKSSRHQMKYDSSQSTTNKYPVYIPESSPANTNSDPNDENDVTSTTKRNNFVRRRPVRPTAASVSATSPRSRTTTESTPVVSNTPKRVRVRGRIRTRPTTTEKVEVISDIQEEPLSATAEPQIVPDEAYVSSTQRSSLQKYTTRGRQATQKYFRRPSAATERSSQSPIEIVEDQASYDSINRPEYVEYKPQDSKSETDDNNPDNGKSESQWSPKLTYNSFRPIFNPNLIADEIKPEGIEYGTKLPSSEINTESTDIITAGLPYDDVLIAVTPSSNNLNNRPSSFLNTELPPTSEIVNNREGKSEDDIITSDTASTFESVLEEVMRNLEQQDENEYNNDYNKAVMKHEGGEIGEIPPEADAESAFAKQSSNLEQGLLNLNADIKKVSMSRPVPQADRFDFTRAEERSFQKFPEVKFQTTSTERQPRRRGVWKKIRVRPAHKDVLETAESQFYRSSGNDLINKEEKPSLSFNKQVEPEEKTPVQQTLEQSASTESESKKDEERDQPTAPTTILPEENTVTDRVQSPGDMDLGTGAPDVLPLAVDFSNYESTIQPNEIETVQPEQENDEITESDNKTEYFTKPTTFLTLEEDMDEEVSESKSDIVTELNVSIDSTDAPSVEDRTIVSVDNVLRNYTQTSVVTEISKDERIATTDIPEIYMNTEKLGDIELNSQKEVSYHSNSKLESSDTSKSDQKDVKKVQSVENISGFNMFDPMSIISTSVSTEVSQETEICYRGRCIKTKKQDHKKVPSAP